MHYEKFAENSVSSLRATERHVHGVYNVYTYAIILYTYYATTGPYIMLYSLWLGLTYTRSARVNAIAKPHSTTSPDLHCAGAVYTKCRTPRSALSTLYIVYTGPLCIPHVDTAVSRDLAAMKEN